MQLLFTVNLRYALPPLLVLGLAMAVAMASSSRRAQVAFGAPLLLAAAVAAIDNPTVYDPETHFTLAGAAIVGLGGALAIAVHRGLRPPALATTGRRLGLAATCLSHLR